MKVVFVTPEFVSEPQNFDGGLANYISKVAKQLKEEGHDVTVCVSAPKNEKLFFEGIAVHRVSVRNRVITAFNLLTLKKFTVLWRWAYQSLAMNLYLRRNFPTDTVIHYTSYTCPSLFAWLAPQNKKVIRFSGYQPDIYLEYNHRVKNLEYRQIRFLERIMINQRIKKFAPSQILIRRLSQLSALPIDLIRTPFQLSETLKTQIVPNLFEKNRKYVLFFGTIGVLKGCLEIAEILPKILEKYPDLHFVFIGKDNYFQGRSFKSIFFEKAGKNQGRVHVFDKMPRNELYGYIQNAHRVLLPSRLDNLPNTLLEALGFDRVIIATRDSSMDEVISDAVNGFLCENGNSASLFDAFERSMKISPQEEERMNTEIRKTMKVFTLEIHVKNLIEFYKKAKA